MKFKLKYKDGAIKKICMLLASVQRSKFSKLLRSGKLNISVSSGNPDFDVISFSGKRDFEEQMLSIASFVFHVGVPQSWVIYSDGSHTMKEKECLKETFPFTTIKEWNDNNSLSSNKFLKSYLEVSALSKKLYAITGHNYTRQTLYADSDIVFYPKASAYFNSENLSNHFWYILDANWERFGNSEKALLNSGLMILNRNFDFNFIFEYLESLNFEYGYFSEQSSFNYSFKKQDANILDPTCFIVDTSDQFKIGLAQPMSTIAMRHYVNPVRHKMWQKGWKQHFEKTPSN